MGSSPAAILNLPVNKTHVKIKHFIYIIMKYMVTDNHLHNWDKNF